MQRSIVSFLKRCLFLKRCWALALLQACLWAVPAALAQDGDRAVVRVPWTASAGYSFTDPDGTPHSFFIDLARMIADEAEFDVTFVEYPSPVAATQAIRDGDADMLAGVNRAVFDSPEVLFAGPVAETQFTLFLRQDAPQDMSFGTFEGARVGAVRDTVASRIAPPDGTEMVLFDDQITAFGKLLNSEVDGVIALSPLGLRTLRKTGLESLIRPSFPPIRQNQHFVALRQEHADLLPRIEAAVTRLEDNGALESLRGKWFMVPAIPVPDVLTVGVTHFPPYSLVEEDGTFSGFSIEVIREVAERANIDLRFVAISRESWTRGPRLDAFDLLPARSVTEAEEEFLEFTSPIQSIDYVTFVRTEDSGKELDPDSDRIGLLFSSPLFDKIGQTLGTELVPVAGIEEAASALGDGTVDAVIFPRRTFEDYVTEAGTSGQFARLPEPLFQNELAIAMRPGLGDLQERLNVVIQGFLGSGQYRQIAARWLEPPQFWTPERVTRMLYGFAALVGLGATAFIIQNWRARRTAERLHAVAAASNSRLAAVLSGTSQAVFGFGTDGSLAIANPSGRALLGLDPTGPAQWPASAELIDPVSGKVWNFAENDIHEMSDQDSVHGQLCLFRTESAQTPRYVRLTSDTVSATESGLASILIVDDDHLNEMNRQQLDRSQRLSSLGMLTGGLAHDFNNVLGSILFNAEIGQMRGPDAAPEVLERIVTAVGAGRNLTHRLLAFSRETPQDPRPVNVGDSFKELGILARSAITEAITLDLPDIDTELFVFCDVGELENALLNLILNARDAMHDAGIGDRITVGVRTYDSDHQPAFPLDNRQKLEVSVSDNGPGMNETVRRHATDPFFTTKDDGGGSGLGLSIVASFVHRASGDMSIYSEPGQGTTVRLRLPRVTAEGQHQPNSNEAVPHGAGQRILLVEDQVDLREPLAAILHQIGYTVEDVETGAEAIDLLEGGAAFDLVLSDIVMPGGISGVELVRALCTRFPDLPVILMTGHANISTEELRQLDVPVLQKPAPVSELAQAIADALRPKGDTAAVSTS